MLVEHGRHEDGIPAPPAATRTASEARAENAIATARRGQIRAIILAVLLVELLIALAVTGILPAQPAGFAASGIFVIILAMTLPFIRK